LHAYNTNTEFILRPQCPDGRSWVDSAEFHRLRWNRSVGRSTGTWAAAEDVPDEGSIDALPKVKRDHLPDIRDPDNPAPVA
jgi:hypothetical protein